MCPLVTPEIPICLNRDAEKILRAQREKLSEASICLNISKNTNTQSGLCERVKNQVIIFNEEKSSDLPQH